MRSEKGHSSAYKQRALLSYVRRLAPDGAARVLVLGDSEFGAVAVMKHLEEWGWYYVLRQKRSHLVLQEKEGDGRRWEPLGGLIERAGQTTRWMENVLLSRLHAHQTNLVLYWKKGEKEPLVLTPVGGQTRVSDVNADEGRPHNAGSNTKLPARI